MDKVVKNPTGTKVTTALWVTTRYGIGLMRIAVSNLNTLVVTRVLYLAYIWLHGEAWPGTFKHKRALRLGHLLTAMA